MYLLTEGETERLYFQAFIAQYDCHDVAVARGRSSDPLRLVSEAIQARLPNPDTWVVLDAELHDSDPTRQRRFHKALRHAARYDIRMAIAEPCFEAWLLSHLDLHKDYRFKQTSAYFSTLLEQKTGLVYQKSHYAADYFVRADRLAIARQSPVGRRGLSHLIECLLNRADSSTQRP